MQDNPPRLEVEVKAWGRGRENWSIYYNKIECFAPNGQPLPVTSVELWDKLDAEVLARSWRHASGHLLSIRAICIDTGSRPKPVYEFARKHPQLSYSPGAGGGGKGIRLHTVRTVIPVKGTADQYRIISSISDDEAARARKGVRIVGVGTHCAKQEIYDGLKHLRPSSDGSPVPGCSHFPRYDMPYFEMLCSEVRVIKENGKVEYQQRNPRNESLDTCVYNRAAAAIVGIDRFSEAQWRQLEAAVAVAQSGVETETAGTAVVDTDVEADVGTEPNMLPSKRTPLDPASVTLMSVPSGARTEEDGSSPVYPPPGRMSSSSPAPPSVPPSTQPIVPVVPSRPPSRPVRGGFL